MKKWSIVAVLAAALLVPSIALAATGAVREGGGFCCPCGCIGD